MTAVERMFAFRGTNMKKYLLLAAAAIVAAVSFALADADQRPSVPSVPAPREGQNRQIEAARTNARTDHPEPQPIELSGRLRKPIKWTPQLELIPSGQGIKHIDLGGPLLRNIEEGTPIRVRGVVRSWLHRGGTKDNPSPFPPQWTIQLQVTHLEVLADPHDVLKTDDDTPLRRIEERMRAAFADLGMELTFEYPQNSQSLIVNYRTRKFMVHGQFRNGEFHEQAHEAVGPSSSGFRLQLHLQEAGVVNAAAVPHTMRETYWTTDLDVRLLKGTAKQVYLALSYGSRVDQDLLKRLRKAVSDLGNQPDRRN